MADISTQVITFTASAIEEIKHIQQREEDQEKTFLRIGVEGGGCSGLSYLLTFDKRTDFDHLYHVDSIQVVVDKRHELYILGMEVDYQHGLNDRGFIFNNPNAADTCGCGTSFSV